MQHQISNQSDKTTFGRNRKYNQSEKKEEDKDKGFHLRLCLQVHMAISANSHFVIQILKKLQIFTRRRFYFI